jgi:hypothetical protein
MTKDKLVSRPHHLSMGLTEKPLKHQVQLYSPLREPMNIGTWLDNLDRGQIN